MLKAVPSGFHRIVESLRLEGISKIILSNCQPVATVSMRTGHNGAPNTAAVSHIFHIQIPATSLLLLDRAEALQKEICWWCLSVSHRIIDYLKYEGTHRDH